jgi:UDP-N-acetylglucosamine:LPS N-acetylglucosamine transferase
VLTADVGEGHLAAARVIADDLAAASPGIDVTTLDALALLGPSLRFVLRDAYRTQLLRHPWMFALLFGLFLRVRALRALGRVFLHALGGRRMRAALHAAGADLVVSTYPAATSVLGALRRRHVLRVPACATVTDLAGVEFWAHSGIDLHLVMHESLVPLVDREAGAGRACVVAPLVAPSFHDPPSRAAARRALGLPPDGRVVLVSGGGWGVGDLAGAAAEAAALPGTTVVCLTGRNEALHAELAARYAGSANVLVLGFTDRMPALLAACDVVVHTTGGVTCLEALTVGRPVVAFGPPAGHAPTLARAMARLGVATHARTAEELRAALLAPPAGAAVRPTTRAADLLLAARCHDRPRRTGARRVAAAAALAVCAAAAFLFLEASPARATGAGRLEHGARRNSEATARRQYAARTAPSVARSTGVARSA